MENTNGFLQLMGSLTDEQYKEIEKRWNNIMAERFGVSPLIFVSLVILETMEIDKRIHELLNI